jgi:hypothetical protein
MPSISATPTVEMSVELQSAFDHFNAELFGGQLPPTLLTLQRQKMTAGYFTADGWVNRQGAEKVDEIALNPKYFAVQTLPESMKNLVLQMTFCWQKHFGTPGRRRYANKNYSDKLISIGLMPSHTGRPGGRTTGEKLDAYSIEGGLFEAACNKLLTRSFALSWLDRFPVSVKELARVMHQLPEETRLALTEEEVSTLDIQVVSKDAPAAGQTRYFCPLCHAKVWGKKGMEGEFAHVACNQLLIVGDIEMPDPSDA